MCSTVSVYVYVCSTVCVYIYVCCTVSVYVYVCSTVSVYVYVCSTVCGVCVCVCAARYGSGNHDVHMSVMCKCAGDFTVQHQCILRWQASIACERVSNTGMYKLFSL